MSTLYLVLSFFSFIASTIATEAALNKEQIKYALTPGTVSFTVIAFLIGPFFLFLGFKFVKPVIFLTGFSAAALAGFILMANLAKNYPELAQNRDLYFTVAPYGIGLVGGVTLLWFFRIAIILIGALGGFAFSLFLLSWKTGGLIEDHVARPIFMGGMTVVAGILTIIFDKPLIVVMTSIFGSVLVGAGCDFFVKAGFALSIKKFIVNRGKVELDVKIYYLLAGVVVLAILGMVIQFMGTARSRKRFKESSSRKYRPSV